MAAPNANPNALSMVRPVAEPHLLRAEDLTWQHEPKVWRATESGLELSVEPQTDFWRITHYDFIRDNGHFAAKTVTGDFALGGFLRAGLRDQFDQLGLMVRIDEEHWAKCGLERLDGENQLSVVLTREFSDWSLRPLSFPARSGWQGIKLERHGEDVEVSVLTPTGRAIPFRVGRLGSAAEVEVGVMAAAPQGKGFTAEFTDLTLRAL